MADFSFMSEQMEKLYRLIHTRIIKAPDAKRFTCPDCGCIFETDLSACTVTKSMVCREYHADQLVKNFWSTCPKCGSECVAEN